MQYVTIRSWLGKESFLKEIMMLNLSFIEEKEMNLFQKIKTYFDCRTEDKMFTIEMTAYLSDYIGCDYKTRCRPDLFYGLNELKAKIAKFGTLSDKGFAELLKGLKEDLFNSRGLSVTLGEEFMFITKWKGKK